MFVKSVSRYPHPSARCVYVLWRFGGTAVRSSRPRKDPRNITHVRGVYEYMY
jgi:hypothetical protein